MRPVVRVIKRGERQGANSSHWDGDSRVSQRSTTEMIVKSWITLSRERRRTEAEQYQRGFKRWEEELAPSRNSRHEFSPLSWSASSISADMRKALTVGAVIEEAARQPLAMGQSIVDGAMCSL